jgi:3-oxoacyl-[acyl-carrier-protein] synthase II
MTRVVVTGVGAVSPVGLTAAESWASLLAARSGVGRITLFDTSPFESDVGAEVKEFLPEKLLPPREARRMDRNGQLAAAAALEAVADAGLSREGPLGPSVGVVFGCGSGGFGLLREQYHVFLEKGVRRVSPFFLSHVLPDAASGHIAELTGAMGPNMAVISACATGAGAIGEAGEVIRRGDAEAMIAGGCEASLNPILFAAFAAMRALASAGDDVSRACKPFDARRDGFVVGEGAGALVLESLDRARARGAPVYAELIGYGSSNDAFDMVASHESGRGPVLAMEMALRKAAIPREDVGYVNAHGTGTPLNDRVETLALKKVFGEHAYRLAVSSTKSMTGHLMGGAGAFEAVVTVLALRERVLPPTANYEVPDPDCDLDYVPNVARAAPELSVALSLSIGLGGHNAALLFRRWEG